MSNSGTTTRWLTAFVLNVAVLMLPVLSIPTCCCASSPECVIAGKCCCKTDGSSYQSRCCCDSSQANDATAAGVSCDGHCQCDGSNVSQAVFQLTPKSKQVDWQPTTLLDWSFVPSNADCSTVRSIQRPLSAAPHNVRQSLLAVWLK